MLTYLKTSAITGLQLRNISFSAVRRIREVVVSQVDDKRTIIKGLEKPSPRTEHLVPPHPESVDKACSLCRLNLKRLNYTDVLILNQFVESNGQMMRRDDTGLCSRKYKLVKALVRKAQACRLIPRPPNYVVYGPWENLNRYYDFPKRYRDQPMRIIQKKYWK